MKNQFPSRQRRIDRSDGERMSSDKPKRVQLKRTRGWRMPRNTVKVDRSSRWGNPFVIGKVPDPKRLGRKAQRELWGVLVGDRAEAIELFRKWIQGPSEIAAEWRDSVHLLGGQNLACWCPLDGPCHADILLELANGSTSRR